MGRLGALLLCLSLAGCGGCGGLAKEPIPSGPATQRTSTQTDRKEVTISVYNDGFGLVREVREIDMGKGLIALEFRDVAENVEPQTVHVKARGGVTKLSVLEQNYRYDLLGPEKLLDKYVGKKVTLYRFNKTTNKDEAVEAEVLSYNGASDGQGPVFKIGNDITYGYGGRIAFPEVPKNLIAKPTLVWLLVSGEPKQALEVSYLTRGFGWSCDYVAVIDEGDTKADLTGWVTLNNRTGATFENAHLKLVAGDVQRVTVDAPPSDADGVYEKDDNQPRQFKEEGFFEYHLYTLERPTSLLQNEQKQVTLLEGHDIKIDKKLIFWGAAQYYRGQYGQVVSNQKVGVYLDIKNEESNHLGLAMPKGVVRVYKADKSGEQQFIGEDRIDHTPRDEKLRIKMGEAFDVVGDRVQKDWKADASCGGTSTWEITLRNHKDKPESVLVYEPAGGDWEILSSSMPYEKKDAHTFTFEPKVPARGETKITYRIRVRWC